MNRVPKLADGREMSYGYNVHACKAFVALIIVTGLFTSATRVPAYTQDAISREFSVFNFGLLTQPSAGTEALSRELSVFNYGSLVQPSAATEALSREVSVFNYGGLIVPSVSGEAVSREVSIFNYGLLTQPSASTEALSRDVSVFNYGELVVPSVGTEALSREISVFNYGSLIVPSTGVEAISREFSVINYGVPQINIALGSTNILGGGTASLQLRCQTVVDLTNLTLTLVSDDSRLELQGVTPASAELTGVALEATDPNVHTISFTLEPSSIPATNHTLAYLNLHSLTNLDSAVITVAVPAVTGLRANGLRVPGTATDGQVILVVNRPILFSTGTLPFSFKMYGIPDSTYSIQATTNLDPPLWIEVQNVLEIGTTLNVTGLTNRGSQQFYRAERVGP